MNQEPSIAWHERLQDDPMFVAGDDDFTNFLQLDIEFPEFDTPMGNLGMDQLAMASPVEDMRGHTVQTSASLSDPGQDDLVHGYPKVSAAADSIFDAPTTQHPQDQHQRKRDVHKSASEARIMVPPTPQSNELQGAAARYYHYMDGGRSDFEPYHGHRNDQMTFTPLASPAVTPIDPNLRLPEATLHGVYFSPLSSPAIAAQNVHSRRNGRLHVSAPTHGSVASPVHQSVETTMVPKSARIARRKDHRKPSASVKAPGRKVRQSPLMKPQGRRKQASLNISPAALTELAEHSQVAIVPAAEASPDFQGQFTNSDGSGQSSISPEPLSDALMPPPTLPRSFGKSPSLVGKGRSPTTVNEPATPATLMKLQNQGPSLQTGNQDSRQTFVPNSEFMEDIMLPESAAANDLPPLRIDTSKSIAGDQNTCTPSAKTPKLTAKCTPRTSSMSMLVTSPTDPAQKRPESRSGHSSRTRQGGGLSHVSPAIMPKISPSIQPLVPHSNPGTPSISAETSALYLASKSNYQNILEGTHLPGVTYPEALAENLSSKRTSHKLAEQGRRNRINVALKEMENLLPPTPNPKSKRDRSGSIDGDSGDKAAASSNSKASTVELAISYIKALQAELSDTKVKLDEREKELAKVNSRRNSGNQSAG